MPITIRGSTTARVGRLGAAAASLSAAVRGTSTSPPGRTGRIAGGLNPIAASIRGQFAVPAARDGAFSGHLSGAATALKGSFTATQPSASNWAQRIADPNVVWYHSFDTAAEVNKFRWAGSYGSGNDPLALAPNATTVMSWQATGGADGGAYLQMFRPAGTGIADSYVWWRPFSPMTGASNGRGVNDPAANGSIPLTTFTPTDGGDQTNRWAELQARPGYYGLAAYQAAGNYGNATYPQFASTFDGQEFYLQVRVKIRADRMTTGNVVNGKLINFCTTWASHPNQELVTVSAYPTPASPVGGPYQANIHNMYEGAFTGYIGQGGNATGPVQNSVAPQWAYSGGWDTLLYHVRPGVANQSNPPFTYDTVIEVWAAHEGESSYTKIWDVGFRAIYDETEQFGRFRKYAWNAFMCWIYQNDLNNVTAITQSYDQIIFSKAFIAVPTPTPLAVAAAQMVPGEWRELVTQSFTDKTLPNFLGDKSSPFIEFTDKMVRDPATKRVFVQGCARGNAGNGGAYQCLNSEAKDAGYVMYDEVTNTWTRLTGSPVDAGAHAYNHMAMDRSTGDYYYVTSAEGFTPRLWKLSGGVYSNLTYPPSFGSPAVAIEWFPERNLLTFFDGGNGFPSRLATLSGSTWTSVALPGNPLMGVQVFMRYSKVRQILYFGGGNQLGAPSNSGKMVFTQNAAGTITRRDDCPIPLGIGGGGGRLVVDPVTGNLLTFGSGTPNTGHVYEFDPTKTAGTQWTQKGTHPLGDTNGQLIAVFTDVAEAGVIMVMHYAPEKVWLYRNSAGVGP